MKGNNFMTKDCKYLKRVDITPYHSDVFDHPQYKEICCKSGKRILSYIHCKRCKEYSFTKNEE
jgi:hypothetical protein